MAKGGVQSLLQAPNSVQAPAARLHTALIQEPSQVQGMAPMGPPCTCPSSNTNTSPLQGLGQVLGYGPMGPPALPQLLQQSLPTAVTRAKCRGSPLLGLAPTTMPHRRDNYGQRARSHLAQLPLQAPCWESQGRVAPAPVAGSHQALFES